MATLIREAIAGLILKQESIPYIFYAGLACLAGAIILVRALFFKWSWAFSLGQTIIFALILFIIFSVLLFLILRIKFPFIFDDLGPEIRC